MIKIISDPTLKRILTAFQHIEAPNAVDELVLEVSNNLPNLRQATTVILEQPKDPKEELLALIKKAEISGLSVKIGWFVNNDKWIPVIITIDDPHIGNWEILFPDNAGHEPIAGIEPLKHSHLPTHAERSKTFKISDLEELLSLDDLVVERIIFEPPSETIIRKRLSQDGNLVKGPKIPDSSQFPNLVQGEYTVVNNGVVKSVFANPCVVVGIDNGPGPILFAHFDAGRAYNPNVYTEIANKFSESGLDWSKARINMFGNTLLFSRSMVEKIKGGLHNAVKLQGGIRLAPSQFNIDLQPATRHIAAVPELGRYYNLTNLDIRDEFINEMRARIEERTSDNNFKFVQIQKTTNQA